MAFKKTSEHLEQSRFFAVIRRLALKDSRLQGAFAIPNGFLDTKAKRIRASREGILSGASDVFIPWPSGGHHGLFLEFKTTDGRVTKAQESFLNLVASRGYKAKVVYGLRDALETLRTYLEGRSEGSGRSEGLPEGSGGLPEGPEGPGGLDDQ